MTFKNDSERFSAIREKLYVPAVCDVLDSLGYRHQAMHQRLRPLLPDRHKCGMVGRARTFQWMETQYVFEEDPYGIEIDGLDALGPGDVAVHSTDAAGTNAPWGELLTTAAIARGAVGAVVDSQIRDCNQIIDKNFPVYYTGIRPLDSMGRARAMAFDVPVVCGDVLVKPNEIVYADFDGIVVIPKEVEDEAIAGALEKVEMESVSRKELQEGKLLREVYDRYGVL